MSSVDPQGILDKASQALEGSNSLTSGMIGTATSTALGHGSKPRGKSTHRRHHRSKFRKMKRHKGRRLKFGSPAFRKKYLHKHRRRKKRR